MGLKEYLDIISDTVALVSLVSFLEFFCRIFEVTHKNPEF
jgi:hypothetical protein